MKNFVIPPPGPIDPKVLSEYLQQSVQSFSDLTGIAVTYFDRSDDIALEIGSGRKPCHHFEIYDDGGSVCRQTLSSAARLTSRLGEPYIFLCQAGLTNIAVSLLNNGELYGCFIAGPIAMGGLRKGTLRRFRDLNDLQDLEDDSCRRMLSDVPVYPPKQISQLALMFYNCVISSISDGSDYQRLRRLNVGQSDLNDSIRELKKDNQDIEYPYELESILIEHVKDGDLEQVEEDLQKLLHSFSVLEVGDLEGIRTKVLWLFAMILRISADRSRELNIRADDDLDIINQLSEARDFEELSQRSLALVQQISRNMITNVYKGNSHIVTDALRLIHKRYQQKLSLQDVAAELHVNPSYLSFLFRQEIGMPFTEYLHKLRIGHACHLLAETDLNIIEIAGRVGFDDQSYFTRIFRKYKDVTPNAYRRSVL